MSAIAHAVRRPRGRLARLARQGSVPVTLRAEATEVAASIGGVLLGALAGDLLAERIIRDPALDPDPAAPDEVLRRLVHLENDARLRSADERRSTYVIVGSIVGGIAAPLLVRFLLERPNG